ncbi:tRNA 4-thiouridine(8) synthase ThiI [Candidatus Parcubacteria bacterium]|nr:tRNA 4-thiouridine(8) synthase ThiI [Candidatus Parcubacteria bacterium]
MNKKALILFSGGLDSILAVKILEDQKIKVKGITFKSYFFDSEQAEKSAKEIKLCLKVVDFSKAHLNLIKSPQYGRGSAMNPCIDCHLLMLKKAKQIMKKEKFDFIVTGEVLGERPMSQNKRALQLVEKESSLTGYLLRPLSAKLLLPTIPEQSGWIDRKKLFAISGRSRKKQLALVKKYKIKAYPNPGGGCILCEAEFGKRLRELFRICPECEGSDIKLLYYGRHFWKNRVKIIVGRNEPENEKLKKIKRANDILVEMENYSGPLILIRNYGKDKVSENILRQAQRIIRRYAAKAKNKRDVKFRIKS